MRTLLGAVGLIVSLSLSPAFELKSQQLPEPYHTRSSFNRPKVIPRPEDAQLQVPTGFIVDVYAEGFQRPRFMILGPSNEVLLSDSARQGGAVYVLLGRNQDGKADEKKKILDGLSRAYGLAMWKDFLYVSDPTSLKRYKYDVQNMGVTTEGEEVVSLSGLGKGHWTRTVLFDSEGEKMYLAVGSQSNVSKGEDPRRAAINRYNPDGSGHEIFASGARNPIGMRWYPGTDTLWAAVQERDGLGDDLVPDYFTSVVPGGFYGWPYSYIGSNEDPRRKDEEPDLVKKAIVPDVILGSHVAVLDALFYTGNMFPKKYQGGAFLAQHGSWNRSRRVGYDVVFVPFYNGKPAGQPREFLTGFMLDPDKVEVWGRPVGLLQLPDGSLLVSDDGGNKIWRISVR